jgi:PhoPQ-activated pathogenicity-related protein
MAEDAAQEGIVKAWRALGRFRTAEPFRPWLLRIVANEARNRRRAAGRRARLAATADAVTVIDKPTEVRLWQASNPQARDFRVDTIGNAYHSTVLSAEKNGTYVGKAAKPETGYTAFFVEMLYPGPSGHNFKFTTEVSVVPDVLPFRWQDATKRYLEK